MARRSRSADVASGERGRSPTSQRHGHGDARDAADAGDGALARIMAVEDRLAGLVSRTRTRAETLVAEAKERADRRSSAERERLAEAEAALRAGLAAERERRLAEVRDEATRELARYAEVEAGTIDAVATWVVDRVVASGDDSERGAP